jgi:hypothetical protein
MYITPIDSPEDQQSDIYNDLFQTWLEEELAYEGFTPEQIDDLISSHDFDDTKYRGWYLEYLYENGEWL